MNTDEIAKQVRMCAACPKMCRHVCPTFFAWRSDSPTPHGRALLIHYHLTNGRPYDPRAIEVLYQCLECSQCFTWCIPEIDIASIVESVRRHIAAEKKAPSAINEMVTALEKNHNPFGEPHHKRTDWVRPRDQDGTPIIYFTGCTAAYREKEILLDTLKLLENLHYKVEIALDEWCCGSPLFRTGFYEKALTQAEHNVEILNSIDAELIVVTCPGCYRALTTDYPENGFILDKPVKHISQLLAERIEDLVVGGLEGRATYHDPCHLGRHCNIYDEPRMIINRVMTGGIIEMERNKANAMCCGNGAGLRTLAPEQAKKIGSERVTQALRTGAEFLVTSCPFCKNMLAKHTEEIIVLDLPELVLRAQLGLKSRNASTD